MDDHVLDLAKPHLDGIDLLTDAREERAQILGSASAIGPFKVIDHGAHLRHAAGDRLDGRRTVALAASVW
jgi:hypothetical protein